MFQYNQVLAQLKLQLQSQNLRAEGIVRSTGKGFGFLDINALKSYFILPTLMKKVMHGDRISAAIYNDKERKLAEPEALIEPFLIRFVGEVHKKDNHLFIIPDYPLLKEAIPCSAALGLEHNFQEGDWAVAEIRHHPLKGDRGFYAELTLFITYSDDYFAPLWVTLARHNLEKEAPNSEVTEILDEGLKRHDLTELDFVTIDSASTEDMDDALYVEEDSHSNLHLIVAIADTTARIAEGSKLDEFAKVRAFTSYLPSLSIPMLPRDLSYDLCSLRPDKARPVIACRMTITADGAIEDDAKFFAATIESKAKLIYDNVSDSLENTGNWRPNSDSIAKQIHLLHCLCLRRYKWRTIHALVLKDRPEYHFVLNKKGKVLDIIAKPRRIANRIVEESMIAANICAAQVLRDKLGFGVYNVHNGFDPTNTEELIALLKDHGIHTNQEELLTLTGFCKIYRELNAQQSGFLISRIRRFQSLAEIKTKPGPHFGLGLDAYATWTSPIRKYGDMVNQRLLKAVIKGEVITRLRKETIVLIAKRRRLNRIVLRDVGNWLYACFLNNKAGSNVCFAAEIIDVNRSGVRVRLIDNGAKAYIPVLFLHTVRDEIVCSLEKGFVKIKEKIVYKVMDIISVTIVEVCMKTRSIIVRPLFFDLQKK